MPHILHYRSKCPAGNNPGCHAYGPTNHPSYTSNHSSSHQHVRGASNPQLHFFYRLLLITLLCAFTTFSPARASGLDPVQYVQTTNAQGYFPLVQNTDTTPLFVDPADWPGVLRAATDLQTDITRVTN